ncbi:hypothetical protein IJN73_01195 [Candidatus Saccharibacteria bacterium]|nr:hypothetical protein [Candidatus Saccharibacteria bacterium]
MKNIGKILKSPALALGLTPLIFTLSQIIVLSYYWLNKGYAGDFSLTVSRYVGLELWTSILFAVFNLAIIVIMFRYYLSLRKSRSLLWFIFGCVQVAGFLLLSIFPHNAFIEDPTAREIVSTIHEYSARAMFIAMFGMTLETLRLSYPSHLKFLRNLPLLRAPKNLSFPKITAPVCYLFLLYGIVYGISYTTRWRPIWDYVYILETGYIYAFIVFLLLTRRITKTQITS